MKLKIAGRIKGKYYHGICEATPEKRRDFSMRCRHKIVYRLDVNSMPPALKKAAIAKCKEFGVPRDEFCVCLCSAEIVDYTKGGRK